MGRKLEGNGIFESSRMMLPEHQERILNHYREEQQKTKPILDAQEVEQIEKALVNSYNRRVPVELKVFDPFKEIRMSGVVTALNTSLREIKLMQGEDNYKWIRLEEVISAHI